MKFCSVLVLLLHVFQYLYWFCCWSKLFVFANCFSVVLVISNPQSLIVLKLALLLVYLSVAPIRTNSNSLLATSNLTLQSSLFFLAKRKKKLGGVRLCFQSKFFILQNKNDLKWCSEILLVNTENAKFVFSRCHSLILKF